MVSAPKRQYPNFSYEIDNFNALYLFPCGRLDKKNNNKLRISHRISPNLKRLLALIILWANFDYRIMNIYRNTVNGRV